MNQQYAGSGERFLAGLIDIILLMIVNVIITIPFASPNPNNPTANTSMVQGISLLISVVYYVVYQGKTGQTLGKKAMKIKVVDASGNKPSMFTFALREIVGKFISGIILLIGYIMILFDSKKQGLHDKIAGTFVVKASASAPSTGK